MNKTKIEWCDMTWNPVTGCLHGCPYCYAEKLAKRYNPKHEAVKAAARYVGIGKNGLYDIAEPWEYDGKILAHPFGFAPTFHRYRLEEPLFAKKPQNIFVCSMADLFGEWVPDEWIEAVFEACEKAPPHRYLFLTKNSKRYEKYIQRKMPSNFWFGHTVTEHNHEARQVYVGKDWNTFTSIEPMLGEFHYFNASYTRWVIIGAETGNRKGKVIPKRDWIENIVCDCRHYGIPVFLKNNLAPVWGEPLIQEYPWEKGAENGC